MHQERAHCQEEKVEKKLCVSLSGVQDASFGICATGEAKAD